ncbi:ethanolamine ammonia-lyase subunit EutC [Rhizobium sp. CF142]|uniref:ethanolamine ammonia-lyase subunit EutC n=1 Tax=Rhizobium sp. CF142 TaxID=1144314 RepID=UPI00026EEB8A|nr:ethanolamine ammonia-lyase subunit EutC [Rhizobium sp. CF142]EJJ29089.1 ethanolamine ammonia-lyase, small subunit [Rhizobium sp. CF142]
MTNDDKDLQAFSSPAVIPDQLNIPSGVTSARLALGRAGSGMPTQSLLSFTLDHARARDAVHQPLDFDALEQSCAGLGLEMIRVDSVANDRQTYLRRPDHGRRLSPTSRELLQARAASPHDVVVVVGDGLSSSAVQTGVATLLGNLVPRLKSMKLSIGPLVLASQARVALADEVAHVLVARASIILLGERPGLSAADSLGAYLTWKPGPDRKDADRNCVSNIRPGGLDAEAAAFKLSWLVQRAFCLGLTGVQLKDESEPVRLGLSVPS